MFVRVYSAIPNQKVVSASSQCLHLLSLRTHHFSKFSFECKILLSLIVHILNWEKKKTFFQLKEYDNDKTLTKMI